MGHVTTIRARPLTEHGFAPFGDVLAGPDQPGRRRADRAIGFADDRTLVVSTTHALPSRLPVRVTELERHPASSQTFLPLDVGRWLVIVSTSLDVSAVRAFVARPAVGVTIGRNVWHHALTVLDGPGRFAVLMGKGDEGDDEFAPVDEFEVTVAP